VGTSCAGDCDGDGSVVINELIQLVNFALGTSTDCSTCPHGIPADVTCPSGVAIPVIIQGVNHALSGCGGS
jgi:predicted aldo/keto reductase-like oxidoreductase